jgi:hypothetical protein
MSDAGIPFVSIAITPMHKAESGVFESGTRGGAAFYLVELVQADGSDAEVLLECRDPHSAAIAARAAAATAAVLGLTGPEDTGGIEAFDEETAAILAENPTPEVNLPVGTWHQPDGEEVPLNGLGRFS